MIVVSIDTVLTPKLSATLIADLDRSKWQIQHMEYSCTRNRSDSTFETLRKMLLAILWVVGGGALHAIRYLLYGLDFGCNIARSVIPVSMVCLWRPVCHVRAS